MQELPDGTRASMEGQVNDKTFADWLKRKEAQTPGFADKTLGKGRAQLWKDGKLTMDQMISGGKPLMLNDLKAKYGAPILKTMDVFKEAKSGGNNAGFYNTYKNKYTKELLKAEKSFTKVVDEHKSYIDDPSIKLGDNPPSYLVDRYRIKWQEDIDRNLAQQAIVQGILKEKKSV